MQAIEANPASAFGQDTDLALFVGDPNLGDRGFAVFSRYFPNATKLIWEKGTTKAAVRRDLRARRWLFTVSLYSDFIFDRTDFDFLGLALNLHPSLPILRGVGYDHLPLIEGHRWHGGTLHHLEPPACEPPDAERDIDSGGIIRVVERPLDATATFGDIRGANQTIMLSMLDDLGAQLLGWGCVAKARRELAVEARCNGLAWSQRYTRARDLERTLRCLRSSDPGHRVFRR